MAEELNVGTYEQIATLLANLATNYSNIAGLFYTIFYDKNPQDVAFQMYDESGVLRDYTVKNLALSNEYRITGEGTPEGREGFDLAKGTLYQDLKNGVAYIKKTAEDSNEGWYQLISKALLDGYIQQGNVDPNGLKEENNRVTTRDSEKDVQTPPLYAWAYQNNVIYTSTQTIAADTVLFNNDGSEYTGDKFFVTLLEEEYVVVYREVVYTGVGIVDAVPGTLYVNILGPTLYMRRNSKDEEGRFWDIINATLDGFAEKNLSNVSDISGAGLLAIEEVTNAVLAERTATEISETGTTKYPTASVVYNYVNPMNTLIANLQTSVSNTGSALTALTTRVSALDSGANRAETINYKDVSSLTVDNTHYPSSALVYSLIGDIETLINNL